MKCAKSFKRDKRTDFEKGLDRIKKALTPNCKIIVEGSISFHEEPFRITRQPRVLVEKEDRFHEKKYLVLYYIRNNQLEMKTILNPRS